MLMEMDFTTRAKAESLAITFKSLTLLILLSNTKENQILCYSTAQLAYGLVLLVQCYRLGNLETSQLWIKKVSRSEGIGSYLIEEH